MNRFLCIHGHFYQPPRENPWIEEIQTQESAFPYDNWNERISAECYHPNAYARILNGRKEIINIVSNYSKISFNFGPTLLSWMEKYDKETYKAILAADKESQKNFGGHGSALAQVYNHIIMPLASDEDKRTQIVWGIEDFKKRFGRMPEGMWLAETAVDTKTLEILAEEGIKFTILAPSQCARTRKIGDKNWQEERNAKVDPKKPYICNLPNGKSITLFFYDGPISQGIAFGDTLRSGERFAARLLSAFDTRQSEQLVHIATDGETYGHHQKFADMALAYCINYVEKNKLAQITVYGQYLEMFPPQYEAQIHERTAWSCCHGVGRWQEDCGCNCSMGPGWHQKWRAPLRKALDFVRDSLLVTFKEKGALYFKDIWAARNAYIKVILDRSKAEDFLKEYGTELALQDKPTALKIMEMQRNTLLMYTSCGWFFDEISGIETVQIMAYAKRAIGYNRGLVGKDIERDFVNLLAFAPSNIPDHKDGANIYNKFVLPMSIGLRKVAINYAVSYLLDEILFDDTIYFYEVKEPKVEVSRQDTARLVTGHAMFFSKLTCQTRKVSFAVLHLGGPNILGGAIYGQTDNLDQIKELFSFNEIEQCQKLIRGSFVDVLDISHLLKDRQRKILANSIEKAKRRIRSSFINVFEKEHAVLGYIRDVGLHMPKLFLGLSEFALNFELKEELQKDPLNTEKITKILSLLEQNKASLETDSIERILTKRLDSLLNNFVNDFSDLERVSRITDFLGFVQMCNLPIKLYRAQNVVFSKYQLMPENLKKNQLIQTLCARLNLNLVD